ncbi:membrane-bound ClpP family serine protease [Alkalibacillus filiformis]|uniref:Membrane-bound ClpP family serine protease n=1 Tax=Alkalibacillus filiformis TaxID=200990 RepID=A0ABU0DU59_9BACI|nr:hypothetical protein [Alkalibacillus filiformis]MDQ0351823.1 membrane-bound ClpP family serine protease [Alkalibacillus filiformis]
MRSFIIYLSILNILGIFIFGFTKDFMVFSIISVLFLTSAFLVTLSKMNKSIVVILILGALVLFLVATDKLTTITIEYGQLT